MLFVTTIVMHCAVIYSVDGLDCGRNKFVMFVTPIVMHCAVI